jgi:hypothetical protein
MRKETPYVRPRAGLWRMLSLALPFLAVLFVVEPASAYTWMIRHGYTGCPVCHADPSGGEILTAYGRAQSDLLLRMRWDGRNPEEVEPSSASGFLGFIEPSPSVLLGGSVRLASFLRSGEITAFPMQLDAYGQLRFGSVIAGGSIGVSKTPAGSPYGRTSQVTTGQGAVYNLLSRTHYLGVDIGGEYTIRIGRLNLPFGIRIPEHTMWVRQSTRTDRESGGQHGVALAFNSEALRGEFMAILGNYQINPDDFRERGYVGFLELVVAQRAALGVSTLYTYAERDRLTLQPNVARGAHGGFMRLAVADPFAVLAEANLLTDSSRSLGYVGFLQGDYELLQGLHVIGTLELQDQGLLKSDSVSETGTRQPGAGKAAVGGWIGANWFFLPHLDIRTDGIFRPGEFTLFTQFHAFL